MNRGKHYNNSPTNIRIDYSKFYLNIETRLVCLRFSFALKDADNDSSVRPNFLYNYS